MNKLDALKLSQKTYFLMQCQERTGVKFNVELAKQVYQQCSDEMDAIAAEINPNLPMRELNKGETSKATPPSQGLKKNGEPTSHTANFYEKIQADSSGRLCGYKFGEWHIIEDNMPPLITEKNMEVKDQAALKDWLMAEFQWTPTFWNFKRDARGKPVREKGKVVKTTPKLHDKGVICPNLEVLGERIEMIKPIIRWMSLRNRRSVIWNPDNDSGWVANKRLAKDGRLPSGSSSITNTHRQKHSVVANIPRVGSVMGEEMRSMFTVEEGNVMVGYDASGLESRVEAHWCYPKRGGQAYAEELLNGDVHTANAKLFFGDDIECDEEGKAIAKYRNPSKNGKYALTYGSMPPTLATTLDIPLGKAKELYENFWQGNTALAQLKQEITAHWEKRGKQSIYCSLTGHTLQSRSEHSLVNLLFQHTGAIVMDVANAFMDAWLGGIQYEGNIPCYKYKGVTVKRILFYHDELAFECPPEVADEVLEMGIRSIRTAGNFLNFNVPLDADGAIGKSWKDIH
jgi:hypothetical protein